jgi:hypothetical protein
MNTPNTNPRPLNAVNPPKQTAHPGQVVEEVNFGDLIDRLVCATETIAFLLERQAVKDGTIKEAETNYGADGAR